MGKLKEVLKKKTQDKAERLVDCPTTVSYRDLSLSFIFLEMGWTL